MPAIVSCCLDATQCGQETACGGFRRYYHSGLLYAKIYRANRSVVRNPDLIYPCQSIFVPRRH
jgi:hypothetical protein